MSVYNKHYQTANLFGNPYPELLKFFSSLTTRGKVLDLGCGQGRDAIALAKIGFDVTGIDVSDVGIQQMTNIAKKYNLSVRGIVDDIYSFSTFNEYDYILLDSMFHFEKNDKAKEVNLIKKIIMGMSAYCMVVFCIQDTGNKVAILENTVEGMDTIAKKSFKYTYEDKESGHKSVMNYKLIAVKKHDLPDK